MKRVVHIVLLVLLALVLLLAVVLGIFSYRNLHWYDKNQRNLKRAGATEQQVTLPSGSVINYGEVRNDKPALLLIHGQMGAWRTTPTCCRSCRKTGTSTRWTSTATVSPATTRPCTTWT